jgi:hypothetical protein
VGILKTFEEEFPELKGQAITFDEKNPTVKEIKELLEMVDGIERKPLKLLTPEQVQENCLSKQRVKEAIEKAIQQNSDVCFKEGTLRHDDAVFDKRMNLDIVLKTLIEELGLEDTN